MARGLIQTIYRGGRWLVVAEDRGVVSEHASRADAVVAGDRLAIHLGRSHVVHSKDGLILEQVVYDQEDGRPD